MRKYICKSVILINETVYYYWHKYLKIVIFLHTDIFFKYIYIVKNMPLINTIHDIESIIVVFKMFKFVIKT